MRPQALVCLVRPLVRINIIMLVVIHKIRQRVEQSRLTVPHCPLVLARPRLPAALVTARPCAEQQYVSRYNEVYNEMR